eukprot:CAMPEP_0178401722 /NCGR_PEP_ID=MMETSP0689_2-20121128/16451_1 /TAXON_ID=160604 /ORGANISM="Amphidinium massartii, Strain CS-259" /LENGTH=59 /DNA_ID=CAMNT_0020022557 /DNA_START=79 /DNA_END=254 /DNA_ORIENTATION=+
MTARITSVREGMQESMETGIISVMERITSIEGSVTERITNTEKDIASLRSVMETGFASV